jgi:hypothetical protein
MGFIASRNDSLLQIVCADAVSRPCSNESQTGCVCPETRGDPRPSLCRGRADYCGRVGPEFRYPMSGSEARIIRPSAHRVNLSSLMACLAVPDRRSTRLLTATSAALSLSRLSFRSHVEAGRSREVAVQDVVGTLPSGVLHRLGSSSADVREPGKPTHLPTPSTVVGPR